ncbi:MAG: hypothetical protein JO339_05980 [Alphaproteobacteria bacterium]|nr:hypothetical protein [Alphaproteobacteria bacterium]
MLVILAGPFKPGLSECFDAATIDVSVEQLDLVPVIKVSQAVSGTIAQEKPLSTLMHVVLAQAGE